MIVIGYQGIGKSTLSGGNNCVDLESTNFYVDGKKPDDWFVMYGNIALDLSRQGFVVFTSSHMPVREYIGTHNATGQKVWICYPSPSLRDEWTNRLLVRYIHDMSEKNKRAWLNALDRYTDNIGEMIADADKYGFGRLEITSMDYSLLDLVMDARDSLHCNGCGRDVLVDRNDYFMLKDEVWAQICENGHVSPDHVLCRHCCERNLGRRLVNDDLADVPLNETLDWK